MQRPHLFRRPVGQFQTTAEETAARQAEQADQPAGGQRATQRQPMKRQRVRRPGMRRASKTSETDRTIVLVFLACIVPAAGYSLAQGIPGWDTFVDVWTYLRDVTDSLTPGAAPGE